MIGQASTIAIIGTAMGYIVLAINPIVYFSFIEPVAYTFNIPIGVTMKVLAIASIFALFSHSALAICLFGDHLVQTARMSDLSFSNESTVDASSKLTANQITQIKNGTGKANLNAALQSTDNKQFSLRIIKDTAHNKEYAMYLYSAGDNIVGFFVDRKTNKVVANVGDGEIVDCKVNFTNYDSLPWFLTN